jgi:hypothetical protein
VKGPPRLDLISMMARSSGTRAMPEMEFVGNLALLIVGGNDTTRNSMSGGLLALSENLGELDKLKANPALVPSLVAETIRYQTPVIHMRRTATRDTELAGRHPRWREDPQGDAATGSGPARSGKMNKEEAYQTQAGGDGHGRRRQSVRQDDFETLGAQICMTN